VHCPQYTVITDALTINSLWYRARSDAWFVTDRDSAAFLKAKGVPESKVHVSGFPVALRFADRPDQWQPPAPAATRPFRVLFMINSGRSAAIKIARALLRHSCYVMALESFALVLSISFHGYDPYDLSKI